jgi:hypothetical protein
MVSYIAVVRSRNFIDIKIFNSLSSERGKSLTYVLISRVTNFSPTKDYGLL